MIKCGIPTKKIYRKLHISKKSSTFAAAFEGKLSEWSKEPHSKCGVHIALYRGFESLTFRKKRKEYSSIRSALFLFEKAGPSLTTVGGSYLGESLERYALIIALTNPSLSPLILQFNPKAVSRMKVGKDDNTIFKERAQMLNDSLLGDTTQFSNLTYAMPLLEQYHRLKSC